MAQILHSPHLTTAQVDQAMGTSTLLTMEITLIKSRSSTAPRRRRRPPDKCMETGPINSNIINRPTVRWVNYILTGTEILHQSGITFQTLQTKPGRLIISATRADSRLKWSSLRSLLWIEWIYLTHFFSIRSFLVSSLWFWPTRFHECALHVLIYASRWDESLQHFGWSNKFLIYC